MGVDIGNPVNNLGVGKYKLILARVLLLVNGDCKLALLARLIVKGCRGPLAKLVEYLVLVAVCNTVNSDCKERLSCLYTLRNDNGAEALGTTLHNNTLALCLARRGNNTSAQVDSRGADCIHCNNNFVQRLKLALLEALTLLESYIRTRHTVVKVQTDFILGRGDICSLCPQEVRHSIAVNTICARLILRHLKLVLRNAFNRCVRVVGVEVNVCIDIFVVEVAVANPLVVCLVEGIAGVVHLVTLVKKRSRSSIAIGVVYAKKTHLVVLTETSVIHARSVVLTNSARNLNSGRALHNRSVLLIRVCGTANCHSCTTQSEK